MAVIFMTEKRIQYYDSMSGSGATCLKVLLRYETTTVILESHEAILWLT